MQHGGKGVDGKVREVEYGKRREWNTNRYPTSFCNEDLVLRNFQEVSQHPCNLLHDTRIPAMGFKGRKNSLDIRLSKVGLGLGCKYVREERPENDRKARYVN